MGKRPGKTISPINAEHEARILFFFYRKRFLITYIIIGVGSLLTEFAIIRLLAQVGTNRIAAAALGISIGICMAYWLNVRFNFKVPLARRRVAFAIFVGISLGSLCLNYVLRSQLIHFGLGYERGRLLSSAFLFGFAYLLHRRFSFRGAKEVGIAVYVDTAEDIRKIRNTIGMFPSFIHVDMVDATFNQQATPLAPGRLEVVRAYWPDKELHVHMMTRRPSQWVKHVLDFADVVIFHVESDEPLKPLFAEAKGAGRRVGIAICMDTPLEKAREFVHEIDLLMFLAIPEPGRSGQVFQMGVLERISALNEWPERRHFDLCVDGGVNEHNIALLQVEKVVSGSGVLNHENPRRQIMRLQTLNTYEAI